MRWKTMKMRNVGGGFVWPQTGEGTLSPTGIDEGLRRGELSGNAEE